MSLLDELRAAYPDNEKLKALSDPELVSLYSQATGASLDLSAMDLGLDPNDYIQNTGRGQDLINQGILGLGDIVSGVAGVVDIPIAGATGYAPLSAGVDWAADATGLSDYAKRLDVTMSPQSQETRTAWDKTWNDEEMGAWDKAKNFAGVLWDDPAYALEFAARSAPTLVPAIGGAKLLGMGAKAMEAAGLTRTAAGLRPLIPGLAEGGVAAGYQMNNLLEEDVAPREAAGYSALTGAGTGIIGGVTGALGARAGLTDPHRRLAGYRLPDEAPALPWYQRIPGGIAMEAGQEALQSPWEQAMTNVATDQPWDQGLARSAVEGAIGGGIIGAPFNIFRGREIDLTQTPDDTGNDQLDPTKGLDTSRVNAPSVGADIRNLAGLNTAEGLSNWAGVHGPSDTAGYAGDLAASYNEPSGHRVADKVTGVERELSTGDWLYYQATGQLPPTTDPVKVEGKPKPVEGVTPEMQRLLDVARNLPMAADPAKVKPGEVSANGHRASGRPTKDAVNWATTLSGLKTEDEVKKAVEKGTRSEAGYWQWVMPMAAARIQEIKAEQAKTTAQQAKQNATVDGPGVSVTPTIAQNAQPVEGAVPPTPTTSSVAQDEVEAAAAPDLGFVDAFKNMGQAISDNLYIALFDELEQGKDTFKGNRDPLMDAVKPFYDAGLISGPEDVRVASTLVRANKMSPDTVFAKAKELGIRRMKDLDEAFRAGELAAPPAPPSVPPPSPTTPETTTNALSGQTTPQAGQETGTTAPDATTEPGVEPEVAVPDYKTLVWGPVVSSTDVKDANGQVNIKSVQVSEDGAWELHRVRTRPQNGRSKNVSIQVVPNPNPPAPTVAAAPTPVPVPPAQPAAPTGPSPVVEKAVTGAPLTNWELDDVVLELGQDILTNELADRVNGWVKPVPKLTKSAERDPQKVAAHNEAVARREQRLDQLRKTVLEVVRNRLALGPYDGAEPDSYDTLASTFILRDTDGRPVLDENNNPVSLPDMRKGTKYGVWTQTQVKALDDLLRLALVRRGVNLNTVDRVEARDVDPDAAIQEVQYDNQTLGASGGVRFQDDALDVSGEGADAAKGVRDLSSLGDVGRQAFSNDVPPGAAAPKAPATEGETEAKPVNIWDGEVDLGTDATHSNIGGADTGAGRKVSGASLMHWARRAGYDVEADPPAAKAKAVADLKELHPLARQSWVDAVNQHAPSTRNEELDATNAAMLDALYRSVSEYQPNERRIGRVDISLRRDTDTIAKTKFAEGLYNLHRAKVPDAPDYTGLLPTEVALFTEATRSTVGPGLNRDAFLRNVIGLIVAGRKQSAQSLLRAGEPATAAGDASRDAGAAADNGQASLRARAGVGETESGAAVESGGQAEPDIVIGARDATGIAVKTRGRLSKEALAAGRESTQSDAATVKRAVRAAGTKAEPQVQQGLGEDVAATNPTTEQTLRDTIASLLGKGHNWRIHVYATPEAAHAAGHTPRKVGNAYGWVEADQKGVKHAYFIVNRIEQGTELGKFLHEVGAHIGLENILSPALYQNLVGQLRKWAALNNDSLESRLAKAALARVESAQAESTRAGREGLDQAGQDSELIAYFLEEAVKAGVDPTATKANSPLGTWFLRLWTAFKRALRKLRIENLDQLQPQHVVDLAYGAARLELNTYWHGTAANFRRFNHDYMGSGEGAQVYSWGTYLAQVFGVGKGYFEDDVKRKNRSAGNIHFNGEPIGRAVRLETDEDIQDVIMEVNSQWLVTHDAKRAVTATKTALRSELRAANRDLQHWEYMKNKQGGDVDRNIAVTERLIDQRSKQLAWLESNKDKFVAQNPVEGSLMRVDVNIRPDEVMHWDLPLNEQPQKVQEVIRQHFGEDLINDEDLLMMTGQELYKRVLANNKWYDPEMWTYVTPQDMATDGKPVSEWFDSIGIKGMEHFDGKSRGKYQEWKQRHKKRFTFEDGSPIQPSSSEERSAFSWLHTHSDKPIDAAIQAALDASTRGLYSWEGEEDRAFYARVAEVLRGWKEKGVRMEQMPRPNLTTNLVVFNDKNIYRVARAPGGDTTPGKVQYGVDVPSHITSAKEAVHNALSDTYTGTNRGLLGWMGINNIAERFGDKLPVLKSIEKTFNEMSHQAKLWLDRGDQIERLWSMLTPKQMELVSFIGGNATLNQFDPSKDQANTPEKQEIAQKWKELQALDAANPKVKGTTTLLAAVQHYRDVHQESLDYLEDVLKQAQAAGASTHAIESVRDTVKALKKKQTHFWLPLHRFGDFHSVAMSPTLFALHQRREQHLDDVRANKANPAAWGKDDDKLFRKLRKDPKHYEVVGHDSERAARRHAEKLQAKGWKATSNINRFTTDLARAHLKPELEAFEKMLAHTKIDPKVATKLIDSYTDLLIEALPDGHILKHQLEREGIAGWDKDMKRAFAKTAQSQAYAVSRMLHTRKLSEQLDKLNRQGESFQPHAQLARDLHNELLKQQELAVTRSEDPYFVRFATGFNYMSMLGGSPFFWALQLAQVPTITLPYLIGRNGANVSDTFSKLTAAWKQATGYIKWSVEANEWRAELDFARAVKGVSKEELEALKEMDRAGRFVFTIGQDLGAAAEGRNTKTARFIRSLNAPTQTTELINRVSTGLAAYRISRKNNDHAKAVEFALRTVDNTQVNMDPVMGARNLKTVFGQSGNLSRSAAKIIFQFWKFQQGMAYTTLTTMKDAWDHPDPALRKQARDSAIGLTISLITTSGIFGLPFVGTGMMLLSFLFGLDGDDDEDDNVERMAKNWIRESPLPKVVADTLNKGFLSAILPTDSAPYLSPRFSLGNLMNPLGYARFDDAERGEDVVKEVMFRVLGGPTGSSAAAFWDGIQAGLDGDYAKATEKMVPLKLMRDLARAYTLSDQGVATGEGEERINPDRVSFADLVWQGMGVTPMKKGMYHEGQAGVQALKNAVMGERNKLLADYAQARLKGEDVTPHIQKHIRFSQRHPEVPIREQHRRQSVDRRKDIRKTLTETGILADKQNRPFLGNAAWTM